MATGTDPTQIQTVSRETSALLQVSPEKVPTAQAAVEEVARATVLSWAPNTTKSYLVGWNDFTSWCIEHNCPGLPAAPDVVGRYLEDLVETQGKALTTARNRLVLQRRFKEGCLGMYEGRLGAWHGSVWPVRCILASPPATAAAHSARTAPGAAFPAPPGRLGAG